MSRCLLCGKIIKDEAELCDDCKKYASSEPTEHGSVFDSDSEKIQRERAEIYTTIKPSDGKGWYILSAIFGALAIVFWIVSLSVAFGDKVSDAIGNITVGGAGSATLLCFLFFFFGQMVKRKNMQIFLQNEIKRELFEIRSKIK